MDNYLAQDPRVKLLNAARARAKSKGIEFSLTIDDIVIPETCPVLDIPLFPTVGQGMKPPTELPNSPSIDRIDNSKGYVRDNICIISMRANHVKKDSTAEELELVVKYMRDKENADRSLIGGVFDDGGGRR